jgi:hypothetical protein
MVCVDNINILDGSVHTVKKNTDAFVFTSKETGIELNTGTTKYMVMSRDQNAGQSHNIEIDNNSFERVEEFKYLGKTLKNKILIMRKLRANRNLYMFVNILFRTFRLLVLRQIQK